MSAEGKTFDPVLVEVINHELGAVTEEMAAVIWRAGQSPMVKSGDFATAVCDSRGRVIGQGFGAPFQLAVFDEVMTNVVQKYDEDFNAGDVIITNDPYAGMGHMPDVAIVVPIVVGGQLCAFCIAYTHHADMGGRFAGSSSSQPRSTYEEGIRLPIMKLADWGIRNQAVFDIVLANVRGPEEWRGDLEAKILGCERGADQLALIVHKHGRETFQAACDHVIRHAERSMRAAISRAPNGTFLSEYRIEDDGTGEGGVIDLKVALTIADDEITIDFTGSSLQVQSALNMPYAMTRAGVLGAIKTVIGPELPTNRGFFEPLHVIAPLGCVLNPSFPAAVGGRAPLFFRIFDVVYGALAKALPDMVPVAGEGGDLLHYSSFADAKDQSAFLDLFFGGWGARPHIDGVDGVAPVFLGSYGCVSSELIEAQNPVVYEGFGFVPDSEGAGSYRGSMAIYRSWRFLKEGHVMLRSVRLHAAPGLSGGQSGAAPRMSMVSNGETLEIPVKTHVHLDVRPGDRIYQTTAGAGGFGTPLQRDVGLVEQDHKMGLVTADRARKIYGVVFDEDGQVSVEQTKAARESMFAMEFAE